MNSFLSFFNNYSGIFLLIMLILLAVLTYNYIQLNKKLNLQKKKYDILLRGRGELNMGQLISAHSTDIHEINSRIDELKTEVSIAKSKTAFSIQKIGFVNYDAFYDLRNKLSFSVAMLDSFNNGMLFTTIFGRESCITYAKEVKAGIVNQELSKEENEALRKAMEQ